MQIDISFPGGKRVDASFEGFVVKTDQAKEAGGDASAPEPFSYFLASMGTCAGIFVLGFCQARNIPIEGIRVTESVDWDAKAHRLARVKIDIHVPPTFPEKYREPVRRAAESCSVKKAIFDPPELVVETTVA
jgi:ribosomal protein S12 methylthiotransferase accessory factor